MGLSVGGLFGYGVVWCGYEGVVGIVDMVDMAGMVGMVTPIHRTELIERFFGGGVHYYSHLFFCFPLFFLGFGGKTKQDVRLCICGCVYFLLIFSLNLGSWILSKGVERNDESEFEEEDKSLEKKKR